LSKVAIVGSGFIGRAWAITFARAGHSVSLWDVDSSATPKAIDYIARMLPDLAENDLLAGLGPDAVLANLNVAANLESAFQENAPEKLDVKIAVFAELDRLSPSNAVIASSSSAILPLLFTESLPGRHRCLVVHPINPPYLIPAAEVGSGALDVS
jgi:L-gulonate 3-dehydrogenase